MGSKDLICDMNRRTFLRRGLGTATAWAAMSRLATQISAAPIPKSRHLTVKDIKRTTVKLDYREVPGRSMARELPHWEWAEIFEVTLSSGHVGIGETLLYYTFEATQDDDVKRAQGKHAVELMWDDDLGAGLQMALFDAVAKAAEVPIHALLGKQVSTRTPLSWWNIDTSVEDMVSECQTALKEGYRAYKTKGRPWFDVWEQAKQVSKAMPDWFSLDMDFNDTLLDAERAIPILQDLHKYPQIDIFESPIFQTDIKGNQAIRKATHVPVAHHYGKPDAVVAIREKVCDGFVIGGGATRVLKQGTVSEMADMPFWLQQVGTGITAAWSLHFGAVLTHATWPAVNCHQLYKTNTLTEPIKVKDGLAEVPTGVGIGYELDRDVLAKFAVPKPARRPNPPRLVETTWPDGKKMYFNSSDGVNFVLNPAREDGVVPFYEPGVTTTLYANDGSDRWKSLFEKSRRRPLLVKP